MLPWSSVRFVALALVLVAAVITDVRERRIPNTVTLTGLIVAVATGAMEQGALPVYALTGAGLALLISFPLYALGGIGAGDAKLFTAVGAFMGPAALIAVFMYGGIAGGVLVLWDAVRRGVIVPLILNTAQLTIYFLTLGRRGRKITLTTPGARSVPYGVAIAVGSIIAWFVPLPGAPS